MLADLGERLDRVRNVRVLDTGFKRPEAFDALRVVGDAIAGTPFPNTVHRPLEQLALYLLAFTFEVEVLEPLELRDAFHAVAERARQLASVRIDQD